LLRNASFWEKSKEPRERREEKRKRNNTVNNAQLRLPRSPDCACTPLDQQSIDDPDIYELDHRGLG
jgi:hypothetical protein